VLCSVTNTHQMPPVPGGPNPAIGGASSGLGGRLSWASCTPWTVASYLVLQQFYIAGNREVLVLTNL
jgi:hypothetical protein